MGWDKWSEWLATGFKRLAPAGIAKKLGIATVAGFTAYGAVNLGSPPERTGWVPMDEPTVSLFDAQEGWLQRKMTGAKEWIGRHPAITGTIAGCVGGSVVPVIGTAIGCVSGATVGYYVGSDERDAAKEPAQ